MRSYFILLMLIIVNLIVKAQTSTNSITKPPVGLSDLGAWPLIGDGQISNNGKYAWYALRSKYKSNIIVKSLFDSWEKQLPISSTVNFTYDSKNIILINRRDSLCLFTLGSNEEIYIPNVMEYKLVQCASGELLAYKLKSFNKTLIIQFLSTGEKLLFENVSQYLFSPKNNALFLKKSDPGNRLDSLYIMDIENKKMSFVFSGSKFSNTFFSFNGTQFACLLNDSLSKKIISFRLGGSLPKIVKDFPIELYGKKYDIENIVRFDKGGNRLFVQLKELVTPNLNMEKTVMMDVWSYQDKKLKSQQVSEDTRAMFAIELLTQKAIKLSMENEEILFSNNDSLSIITQRLGGSEEEWNWNKYSQTMSFLLDTYSGERLPLKLKNPRFFPNDQFIYGTNTNIPYSTNDIVIYNIKHNKYDNITHEFKPSSLDDEIPSANAIKHRGLSIVGLVENRNSILVRDKYDLWMISMNKSEKPICITNGYGRKNRIRFNIILNGPWDKPYRLYDTIILKAFNERNKEEGFYSLVLDGTKSPTLLSMRPFKIAEFYPKKAKSENVYLLKLGSALEPPNFFWTKDLQTYQSLSNNQPQKSVNWMTAELINWKSFDGNNLQGVLYKPENFDPQKKYPVIFHFYERLSDKIYLFKSPALSNDDINIPWFVSNGYVVCTPDIEYKIGKPGHSTYNSVISCVQYLTRFPWVDSKRLGLQGHSFGGYEANYLITHSNAFAAAISTSGPADLISGYNGILGNGISSQFIYEIHQDRLGATLWDSPQVYIENSPIMYAHKVSVPLLMMHNKADGAVPFAQGLELFLALRRLGKRVWLLQYDEGGHSVYPETTAPLDYTKRMMQFFDHYLKDSACPRWMLYGIDAKNKGMETGYELVKEKDKNGKWLTPLEGGLLTDEEKKKVQALKNRKPVTVILK